MKNDNEQFEKNISRLVKRANKAEGPSENFVESLIDEALSEAPSAAGPKRTRGRRRTIMSNKSILALAATVAIVCTATVLVLSPRLQRARENPGLVKNMKIQPEKSIGSGTLNLLEKESKDKQDLLLDYGAGAVGGVSSYEPAEDSGYNEPVWGSGNYLTGSTTGGRQVASRTLAPAQPIVAANMVDRKVAVDKAVDLYWGKKEGQIIYPPAHGGTTPPNGQDVDAMFFKNYGVNPFVDTEDDHLSTFASDVDTGSYTLCRGYLRDGHLPPDEAVRVEEFVNYFDYGYKPPQEDAFAIYAEAAPWNFGQERKNSYLMRIGLKGKQITEENRKPCVLTFVVDISGSMDREDRLGLVKRSLKMLVGKLRKGDYVGIAVYGSNGREFMAHRSMRERDFILSKIDSLCAGGSTYAEEGIRIGYEMAEGAYRKGYVNRVILCSDGVANVGKTGADDILKVIKAKASEGVTLSAIGFGMGNYNDVLMEQLGDKGNGYYAYVDTIEEARRLFEDNLTGSLQVIGRDVKVQVDFNPKVVRSYRLIGYENRNVPDNKFRDDKYDGGEVGAGHSVTALYELKLWPDKKGTVATTYVRYKDADTYEVSEFAHGIDSGDLRESFADASAGFRLAATVGEFAEILRKSYWAKGATLDTVLSNAKKLRDNFEDNTDVTELVRLISRAKELGMDSRTTDIDGESE